SFYNESAGRRIHPTPVVGVLGVLDDAAGVVRSGFPRPGLEVHLLGETRVELGGSAWQRLATGGRLEGRPPALDLAAEARLHRLLVDLAAGRLLASAHDLSDGGLAVALVEAVLGEPSVGATIALPAPPAPLAALVSESASRVLVSVDPAAAPAVTAAASAAGVPIRRLGRTGGTALVVPGVLDLPIDRLREAYEGAIPRALGEGS
ncbi:MAG TPA: AIR synthase-related protein, partial [Actinomycetota bacterium]|nr:AIR synthase-related protein [Actinomycetota bacterium]